MSRLPSDPVFTADPDTYQPTIIVITEVTKAQAENIIFSDENSPDGRSQFYKVVLDNGDVMLACFPHGVTYLDFTDNE